DDGRIVALDTPEHLKDAIGGDVLSLRSDDNEAAMLEIRERYGLEPQLEDGQVVFNVPRGEQFLPEFVRGFGQRLLSVGVRRPTLEDVFLKLTGHAIRDEEASPAEAMRRRWGGRR
ncbi:MAG: ABC transporter ATP-binding protein, partial [Chloroflexi bacterium]|nr:ABC transporter ATP-binding protein [Chloroflexota bacterium]